MSTISHLTEAPSDTLGFAGTVALTLGALDFALEGSIIVPALPAFADYFDASLIAVGWLATGFLLASVIGVPLLGRLGDMFGKRLMLLFALGAFSVGALICAVTGSIELAILGRVIQGFGAAAGPLTLALARDTVAPAQLARVIGAVIGAASVGGGIGFLLGGVLVDRFSPAAVFWALFALGMALIVAIALFVRESPLRAKVRLDVAGVTLLAAGLVVLLLAISKGAAWGWSSEPVIGLLAGSAVLLALFALVESRVREPHVDLRLVIERPFANTNVCVFAFGFAFFTASYLIPQIAAAPERSGYGLGLSTTQIGLLLVPSCAAGLFAASVAGRVADRTGPRALVAAGSLCGLGGNLALSLWHGSVLAIALGSSGIGLGWGFILPGIYMVVLRWASADKSAVAASVTAIVRNTGVSVGVSVAFAIVTAAGLSGEFSSESGFVDALLVAALGSCATLVAALTLPGRHANAERARLA